jgi:hypothetical protein
MASIAADGIAQHPTLVSTRFMADSGTNPANNGQNTAVRATTVIRSTLFIVFAQEPI